MYKFTILKNQQIHMNYNLKTTENKKNAGSLSAIKTFLPLLLIQKKRLIIAIIAIFVNSGLTLLAPIIIGHIIDTYITTKQFHGVLVFSGILLGVYLAGLLSSYLQTKLMGVVGQQVLFNVRNSIFEKLQSLPIAFFNQNKAGDLISRINNDTDKLNMFLSQSLIQFVGSIFVMTGAGILLVVLNPKIGLLALIPAVFILIFNQIVSPWVKRTNTKSLQSIGGLSSEIQESIENFKVIIAFNRRDYFRNKFDTANKNTYMASTKAGIANNIFAPVYGFASNVAQLVVFVVGIYFITKGQLTIGFLISFLAYTTNFYTPLRQIAATWASFQVAMAGWDRILDILNLKTDLEIENQNTEKIQTKNILEFKNVDFVYHEGKKVLENINFSLQKGKTYALVGPTGGGKTTTASLVARLFDPTKGEIFLEGKNLKSYSPEERTQKIGFILQEPFLFSGTLLENILYGNREMKDFSSEQVLDIIKQMKLGELFAKIGKNLEEKIITNSEKVSLGQKQLIAFVRAILRKPEILILDEATASIDTITESLLQKALDKLDPNTTLIIIAHRLNTIEKANEIFFVNANQITSAGSIDHAIEMLLHGKRES